MAFALHERLAADTLLIADLPLCRALLMNDRRFPWVILVPRREGLRDFDDVAPVEKPNFHAEIDLASEVLREAAGAEKMNVAALGNMVPQLHVHVIARFSGDAAWPGPVWGVGTADAYSEDEGRALVEKLRLGFYG
ncbi:HIT domain-containing protein [Parvibaculum sp.]|jgi:diadenosine tetraphosphate (Ap4A) HIT family hydrolase|uniref:HIT domain-containing protein n=1 Tax=Parvibaculum sp. TaxID=2024848 RepID=UPI000C405132|nr:HIT domain-containing protein [Parvibaculum sp.]MAM93985.1 diadenosine tetraphosphate hydrolase [Parvibaculum sp.]|tara:strand:- start:13251 stop:13658 length:408 start_codon:yes stop_codon:yes gene_type:complete